ncbi:MAG: bifunctional chorismate mutase/prephenate dehydrogenase [Wenzhouxiangellaceae bacterium]
MTMADDKTDLDALRQRLDQLDAELLDKVAERQRLVAEIGRYKHARGRHLRDFARERVVLEQAAQRGEQLGLSRILTQGLMSLLIEHSLQHQEQRQLQQSASGSGRQALVIGGHGRMGRWFADYLHIQGYAVTVADPAAAETPYPWVADWRQAPLNADLLVVAAPMAISAVILDELAAYQPSGVVFDLGSLKMPLAPALQRLIAAGVQATSLHPLFGPDVRMLSGRHVAVVDMGCAAANRVAHQLFAGTMAEVIELNASEHDRLMAYVLSCSHFLNIVFTQVLAQSDETTLRRLSSTTFARQLAIARDIAAENALVYYEIQRLNPYAADVRQQLATVLAQLDDLLQADQREDFYRVLEQNRRYFDAG